jgi:hypothetical protein
MDLYLDEKQEIIETNKEINFGSLVICGTVRNCASYLEKVFENMLAIGSLFSNYKIVISYDSSNDGSLEILKGLQERLGKDQFILHINTEPLYEYRVYNIAKARNKCLDIIRQIFSDYEYFIMMDCDDVCSQKANLEIISYYLSTTLDSDLEWDSVSFNKDPYYDLWALSKYPYSYGCMHFANWASWGTFIEKIIKETPPNKLIPCLSAFNGFAIYKTNKFLNCYYDPKPRFDLIPSHLLKINEALAGPIWIKGKAALIDCEHRSFHLLAINKNNAKIRISPLILFSQ